MRTLVCVLTLALSMTAFAQKDLGINPGFPDVESINTKEGVIHCLTNEVWRERKEQIGRANFKAAGPCDEGNCDDPVVRDATAIGNVTVDVIVHVMRDNNGNNGVSQATVNATIAQMNADYAGSGTGIQFNLVATRFHNNSTYACISAYSPFNSTWYNEILQMRRDYAETPDEVCNIYIGCQDSSPWGVLLGIATFPWDPAALTNTGGFWLNNLASGSGETTASHEMGHCLGLWHTHHGVSEVDACSTCYELADGTDGDSTGDFCSDTPPTPTNQNCSDPGGSDCAGTPWGNTQEENIMGYSNCRSLLTTQQSRRMHCWSNSVLSGWFNGGGGGPTNQAPTASFTYNANNLAVSFDGSGSSDSDGTITSYAWDFGDGNNGSGQTVNHTYASAGTYSVTLTVTDNDGATDTDTQSVTVTSGGGGGWTTLVSSDFESGWQSWVDGGSDVRRSSRDSAYASQGTFCVRLRDNSGAASAMSRSVSFSGYSQGRISFNYYPRSMENNEDFFVEVSSGSGWTVVGQYRSGTDFSNNNPTSASVTFNASGVTSVRIRCDASANNDQIYVDEVVIEGQ
ncbi:MAG: PKD domain-containing protein [Acidobacteriota bacterium]|nr:PKD domain-containing protein [Acidobacteriota bacterium]